MSLSQNPTYNVKAVLKETGIKAELLRAWERRYGLPQPQRSMGGHRLYSQRDVEIVRWLLARQGEGLSISRAVGVWRKLETDGRDPFTESRQMAVVAPVALSNLDDARREWLTACLSFNEPLAEQTLNQAFALHPLETVCTELLQKGLVEIGNLWYENRASVQQEHFASGLALQRLHALLAAAPPPNRTQTVLVGCPSSEAHSFTVLLLALFLRRRGLRVIYLGANVPGESFEETVQLVRADLVVLAAQQLISAASLQQVAATLAAHGVSVAYDGRIFNLRPSIQQHIAGHFLGGELIGATERVLALLAQRPTLPQVLPSAPDYLETLEAFLTQRTKLDAALEARASSINILPAHLTIANHFLGNNLAAALRLGDLSHLDDEVAWLNHILETYQLPLQSLREYFRLYLDVVRGQLGTSMGPLEAWLESQIEVTT